MSKSKELVINGWYLLAHPLFLDQFEQLISEVENIKEKNPAHYKDKNSAKRLAAITKLIFEKVPQNPILPEYRQGTTLGDEYKYWLRAEFIQQYRLFFRYHLKSKIIVYAWVNDTNTKRAYNNKSDAYNVFKKKLTKGHPTNDWKELLKEAMSQKARFKQYDEANKYV